MTRKEQFDIYNELDNFVEENMGEVTHTEIAQHFFELGRNNAINKACEWLEQNAYHYCDDIDTLHESALIGDFRHAMKGE